MAVSAMQDDKKKALSLAIAQIEKSCVNAARRECVDPDAVRSPQARVIAREREHAGLRSAVGSRLLEGRVEMVVK